MSYVLLTPSGRGTLQDVCGPFPNEQDAQRYADEHFYFDPRWGQRYQVVPLDPPVKKGAN